MIYTLSARLCELLHGAWYGIQIGECRRDKRVLCTLSATWSKVSLSFLRALVELQRRLESFIG